MEWRVIDLLATLFHTTPTITPTPTHDTFEARLDQEVGGEPFARLAWPRQWVRNRPGGWIDSAQHLGWLGRGTGAGISCEGNGCS